MIRWKLECVRVDSMCDLYADVHTKRRLLLSAVSCTYDFTGGLYNVHTSVSGELRSHAPDQIRSIPVLEVRTYIGIIQVFYVEYVKKKTKKTKKYDGNVHMYLNSKAGERTYVHTCEKNKMVELKTRKCRFAVLDI